MRKKITCLTLVFMLLAVCILPATTVNAAEISLNKSEMTLVQRDTARLYLTNYRGSITWSSSDKKIATVSKAGIVKAAKAGNATITASAGGKKYTCKVKVLSYLDSHYVDVAEKAANSLSHSWFIKKPETVVVTDVYEGLYTDKDPGPDIREYNFVVAFTADNESGDKLNCLLRINTERDYAIASQSKYENISQVYTVENEKKLSDKVVKKINKLIPLMISGKYTGNTSDTYVGLSCGKVALRKGKTFSLSVNNTTDKVTWSSANTKVAKVSSKGEVTGVKLGKTKVTAKVGKDTFTCEVTVMKDYSDEDIAWLNTIRYYYNLSYSPSDFVIKKVEYGNYSSPAESDGVFSSRSDYTYKITLEVRFSDETMHERYFWGNASGHGGQFSTDNGDTCPGTTDSEMSEKDLKTINKMLQAGAFDWAIM